MGLIIWCLDPFSEGNELPKRLLCVIGKENGAEWFCIHLLTEDRIAVCIDNSLKNRYPECADLLQFLATSVDCDLFCLHSWDIVGVLAGLNPCRNPHGK